jgi:cytochrome c-type biogenesis protein CcmH
VHRRQLAELDDLAARGLLSGEDLEAARTEASRRLLSAAETAPAPESPGTAGMRLAVTAIAVAAGLVALGLYILLGRPGVADQPYQARLSSWKAAAKSNPSDLTAPQMAAVLKALLVERADDPRGWAMLGQTQMSAGEPGEASRAFAHAIRLAPKDPDLQIAYGEAVMSYSEGKITPDALSAFKAAQAIDPANGAARYYLGRARIADGKVAEGLADWRQLAASLPEADEHRSLVLAQIAEVEKTGGLPTAAAEAAQPSPGPAGGPAGGPLGTPGAMGGADQSAFIQSMVARLAARLDQQPNDPDGWARLVRAYGVLKNADAQAAALTRARKIFAGNADALARIEAQARAMPAK